MKQKLFLNYCAHSFKNHSLNQVSVKEKKVKIKTTGVNILGGLSEIYLLKQS